MTAIKCYCEYTNGTNHNNGIMCGNNGKFTRTAQCNSDEICIGRSNLSDAVFERNKGVLCAKGKLKYIVAGPITYNSV